MADPRIQKRVRFEQEFDRLPRVIAGQREAALEDFRVGLRLGVDFRREYWDQLQQVPRGLSEGEPIRGLG